MPSQPSDFAAVIGLDWADRKHDICLMATGQEKPEFTTIAHDPIAIDAWARPSALCARPSHVGR